MKTARDGARLRRAGAPAHGCCLVALLAAAAVLATTARAEAQTFGFRMPGSQGLKAAAQPSPGVYVTDLFAFYAANEIRDRQGDRIGPPIDLAVTANVIGFAGVIRVDAIRGFYTASLGIPLARLRLGAIGEATGIDRRGLTDIHVQPIRLGWRVPFADLTVRYAFYAPTGLFDLRGRGLSSGQWTHELSAGTVLWLGGGRRWHLSLIGSYVLNRPKLGIDLQRGDSVLVQGGLGVTLARIVDVGVAGFGDWQVSDDRGAALPPGVAGARQRSYGLGPEVDITLPWIRSSLQVRYEVELGVRAQTRGQVLVVGLTIRPF